MTATLVIYRWGQPAPQMGMVSGLGDRPDSSGDDRAGHNACCHPRDGSGAGLVDGV